MALTRPRASQIYDIDYKQATRVITVSNITLSGGAPSQVDGVNLSLDDRILVTGQTNKAQNGIYFVDTVGSGSNGTWVRSNDTNSTGELLAGTIVMVTEGTVYHDTQWKLTTNDPIVIGVSELVFEQNSAFAFGNVYANSTAVLATSVGDVLTLSAGNNISITGNNTSKTVTIGVTGISLNSISNGTSNVNVVSSGGNVTVGVAGTGNVAVFSSSGQNVTGYFTASGNVTGGNISTSGLASVTGNITGGNLITAGLASVTGNITGGNLITAGLASVTGNITGGNVTTAGQISATGTITSTGSTNGTAFAVGNSAVSNVALGFFPTAGTRGDYAIRDYSTVFSSMYFDVGMGGSAGGEFRFRVGNSFNDIMTANSSGVITSANVYARELNSTQSSGDEGGQINLAIPATNTSISSGVIVDIYQNKLRFFESGGTNRGAYLDITGCGAGVGTNLLSGGGGGSPGGSNTNVQFNDGSTFGGNGQFTYDKVTNILTAGTIAANVNGTGQNFKVGDDAWIGDINQSDTIGLKGQQNAANCYIVFGNSDSTGKLGRAGTGPLTYAGAFTATGNVTGGNLITAGLVSAGTTITATGNVAGGNITTGGNVVATANVSGGNVAAATAIFSLGTVGASGNTSGGNLTTAGQVVATGNITGGNLKTSGVTISSTGVSATTVTATANVAGGNLTTAGQVVATGNITGGNLITAGLLSAGIVTTPKTISSNLSIPASTNAMLISPTTINTGVTVTIPDTSVLQVIP